MQTIQSAIEGANCEPPSYLGIELAIFRSVIWSQPCSLQCCASAPKARSLLPTAFSKSLSSGVSDPQGSSLWTA